MSTLTRTCYLVNKVTNEKILVTFRIHDPVEQDDGANYSCVCDIDGLDGTQGEVWGLDSLQAVELSLAYLQVLFDSFSEENEFQYTDGTKMDSLLSQN